MEIKQWNGSSSSKKLMNVLMLQEFVVIESKWTGAMSNRVRIGKLVDSYCWTPG